MSLKNQNESDDSMLDISKLSKESKKRKIRRKPKELPTKPINSLAPTIFKSTIYAFDLNNLLYFFKKTSDTELELSENLLNYVHKLEFLIERSYNQIQDEREKFTDFLFS